MDKRLKHVFILGTAVALTTACDDNSIEKVEVLAPISLGQLEVPVSGHKI